MLYIIWFFIFIFGAIVGSFLNVVTLRLGTGESIVSGGSKCFSCGKRLRWRQLFPIFSFIFQRGRCSGCKSKISWQYPLVEAATGLIFWLLFVFSSRQQFFSAWPLAGDLLVFVYFLLTSSLLIAIAVYDYHHQIIPNVLVYPFIVLSFGWLFRGGGIVNLYLEGTPAWKIFYQSYFDLNSFFAGIGLFSFFALLWLVSRGRWMGFGDAKLAVGMGWLLGISKGITALMVSFWLGAIVGIFLLFFARGKYNIKSSIAFGPFLILGFFIALFLGDYLVDLMLI